MTTLNLVRDGHVRPALPTLRGTCDSHPLYVAGCTDCQERSRSRRRARYRDAAYGLLQPGLVCADEARAHIESLHNHHGISYRQIAKAASVGRQTVADIADGTRQQATPATKARILAVTPDKVPTVRWVPSIGASRRLQGLALDCYSAADLAPLLHTDRECVLRWRSHHLPAISIRRNSDITGLTDRLAGTTGPSPHARTRAVWRGWAPFAAWDDIDNPDDTPHRAGDSTRPDRLSAVLVRRVLDGRAPIDLLTPDEQLELWQQWSARRAEAGLTVGQKSFARAFGVSRHRGRRLQNDAVHTAPASPIPTLAAERRTDRKVA